MHAMARPARAVGRYGTGPYEVCRHSITANAWSVITRGPVHAATMLLRGARALRTPNNRACLVQRALAELSLGHRGMR